MGRGSPTFISPSWRRIGPVRYIPLDEKQLSGVIRGVVRSLEHDPGRGAPVAVVELEDGREMLMVATEGMYVGQTIEIGAKARVNVGNVLPLFAIPEGTMVANVEKRPGDGGKFARAAGTYAVVLAHNRETNRTIIQLPSGRTIEVPSNARATIGIVAGGGITEKPLLKAGKAYHKYKAKATKWPKVRGKAMSPYAHPHGGRGKKLGPTSVPRNAPPGAKVGHIAPRRTGRKRGTTS